MKQVIIIFNYIIGSLSFLWKKSDTKEEKLIKRYDITIFILFICMLFYGSWFFLKEKNKYFPSKPQIIEATYTKSKDSKLDLFNDIFNIPVIPYISSIITIPIIDTNVSINIPTNQFFEGEVVCIKSFAVFGIIHQKVLNTSGFVYTVRYKDNSHTLHDIECNYDELFRPSPNSLIPSALIN